MNVAQRTEPGSADRKGLPASPSSRLLSATQHRPWPLPRRPWFMRMCWHDLLFAHWPVEADRLRPLVPEPLEIDTFAGQAWIGLVPFWMSGIRLRRCPPIPTTSSFPEVNVRTYVRLGERAGVWFFSLDAASRLAVRAARWWYRLPYHPAAIAVQVSDGAVSCASRRRPGQAPAAVLQARYEPIGEIFHAVAGSLQHFLTERYCMYSAGRRVRLLRTDIHHAPWPLQPAAASFEVNSMLEGAGLTAPSEPPLYHFSKFLETVAWWPEAVIRPP